MAGMPLALPGAGFQDIIHNLGTVGAANPGTTVTTGGATGTKGTAVELISAANNTRDSVGIIVTASGYGLAATACDGALDILIGGATDDILIPNLLMGYCGDSASMFKTWFFPLHVPGGVRVAAQAAGRRVSTGMQVQVFLIGGEPMWRVGRKVTTYGMGTVPNGTAITPGASGAAATETQITASTSEEHFAVLPSYQITNDSTIANSGYCMVGIGVGAATGDRVGTWMFGKNANESCSGPTPMWPAFCDIPSGTRLSLFASNSTANDAGQDAVIHAVS